jgi:hypothetical protein
VIAQKATTRLSLRTIKATTPTIASAVKKLITACPGARKWIASSHTGLPVNVRPPAFAVPTP